MPVLREKTPHITDVALLRISSECIETEICKHDCKITLTDGIVHRVQMSAPEILYLQESLSESKVKSWLNKTHFSSKMANMSESEKESCRVTLRNYVRIS